MTFRCPRCLEEDRGDGMHSVTKCIGSSLDQLTELRAENARLREALINIGQARIVNSTELQRIARAALEVKS